MWLRLRQRDHWSIPYSWQLPQNSVKLRYDTMFCAFNSTRIIPCYGQCFDSQWERPVFEHFSTKNITLVKLPPYSRLWFQSNRTGLWKCQNVCKEVAWAAICYCKCIFASSCLQRPKILPQVLASYELVFFTKPLLSVLELSLRNLTTQNMYHSLLCRVKEDL